MQQHQHNCLRFLNSRWSWMAAPRKLEDNTSIWGINQGQRYSLDWSLGIQLPWICHARSPHIPESHGITLAVQQLVLEGNIFKGWQIQRERFWISLNQIWSCGSSVGAVSNTLTQNHTVLGYERPFHKIWGNFWDTNAKCKEWEDFHSKWTFWK